MQVDVVQIELRVTGNINITGSGYIYQAKDAAQIFVDRIGKCNVENVGMLCMDSTGKIINYSAVSIGDVDNVQVKTEQIIKTALLSNASKIIIAHNHPSGVLSITGPDIKITKHIGAAAKLMGIELMDSLIVNAKGEMLAIRSHIRELECE